ncbi:MAG: CBS domain-containing protein [Halobacteriota archaeon]
MLVHELMSTDIVAVSTDGTLREAAEAMLKAGVGSVIVTHEDEPVGILTETDALKAGYAANRAFEEIPVHKVMSHPLRTIHPNATVRAAVDRMRTEGVKKLPVVEDLNLVGIITATDVANKHDDMIREALAVDRGREGWQAESIPWEIDE